MKDSGSWLERLVPRVGVEVHSWFSDVRKTWRRSTDKQHWHNPVLFRRVELEIGKGWVWSNSVPGLR